MRGSDPQLPAARDPDPLHTPQQLVCVAGHPQYRCHPPPLTTVVHPPPTPTQPPSDLSVLAPHPGPPTLRPPKRPSSVLVSAVPQAPVPATRPLPTPTRRLRPTHPGTTDPHPPRHPPRHPHAAPTSQTTPTLAHVGPPSSSLVSVRRVPYASAPIRVTTHPVTVILGSVPSSSNPCACSHAPYPNHLPRSLWSLTHLPSATIPPCPVPGHYPPPRTACTLDHLDISPPRQRPRLHSAPSAPSAPPPGNSTFHMPTISTCCQAAVSWPSPAALRGRCARCCLCVSKRPRALPRPAAPHPTVPGWLPGLPPMSRGPIHPAEASPNCSPSSAYCWTPRRGPHRCARNAAAPC